MVLLPQGDASLVQQTIVQADVLPLRLRRNLRHLEGFQADAIGLAKSHHVGDEDGSAATKTSNRKRAFDGTTDATRELEPLLQRELGTASIIAPVPLLYKRRHGDIELHMTSESLTIQDDLAILPDIEPQIHPLINSKPRHQPMLVIHMRAQRAYAVGGEDVVGHISFYLTIMRVLGYKRVI